MTDPEAGTRRTLLVGLGLAAVSSTAFGTVAPLAKVAYERGADAFPLLAVRFAVAALVLVAWNRARGRSLALGRANITRLGLLGGIGYAFEASLFFLALELAPAGIVSLIFFSYPLITTVLSFTLGLETFRRATIVALALGTLGVASIFGVKVTDPAGPLLALGAAFAVAVYYIAAGFVIRGIDAAAGATWTAAGAATSLTLISVATGRDFPMDALPAALALGAVTSVAFTTLFAAIALIGSSRAAIAAMLEPVVTVVLAAAFLDETITARIAVGAAFVIASLPILAASGHRETGLYEETPAPVQDGQSLE